MTIIEKEQIERMIRDARQDINQYLQKNNGTEFTKAQAEELVMSSINLFLYRNDPNGIPCLTPAENSLQVCLLQKATLAMSNGEPIPLSEQEGNWLFESLERTHEYMRSNIHKDLKEALKMG